MPSTRTRARDLTRWLSCETLLLCMPVDLSQLSERETKALSHTIANQLGPEHTPAAILSTLRLEGHEHELMEHLQPYLHFRLLLLIYKRPGAFPSPTAFQDEGNNPQIKGGLEKLLASWEDMEMDIPDTAVRILAVIQWAV